jgi:REase_MTES_1575
VTTGQVDRVMARVAAANGGPFTHREARRVGLTVRQIWTRVANGYWVEVLPRVYVHAATLMTDDVRNRAALRWAGRGAVLSHRSAGALWGLDAVTAERPEITIVGTRHPRSAAVAVHRSDAFDRLDRARHEGLPVTSPTRTVIDLAAVLDADALRIAFESARRERLTTVRKVRARLDVIGGTGRPGSAKLHVLLDRLDGQVPSEYPLEVKVAALLEGVGLEPPVRQYEVRAHGRVFRLDFAWPARRLALECDGRLRHSEDSDFARDRDRWTVLASIGWRLLYATWTDVTRRPETLVERLKVALAA